VSDVQVFKIVDVMDGMPILDERIGSDRVVRIKLRGSASLVAEVTVNGDLCKSFAAVSEHLLDVVLPSSALDADLETLRFVILSSGKSPGSKQYEILFDIGKSSKAISGTDYLIQKWIRFLLMSQGSDKSDPTAGCGLLQLAAQVNINNMDSARVEVARIHDECRRQIMRRQMQNLNRLQRTEILRDARLSGVGLDSDDRLVVESLLIDGSTRAFSLGTRV
jgi:hypothetical protein